MPKSQKLKHENTQEDLTVAEESLSKIENGILMNGKSIGKAVLETSSK